MSVFSKFLQMQTGADRQVDLSNVSNVFGIANLELLGSTSGGLTMVAAATTTPYTLTWPGASTNGVLTNTGGTLSWASASAGTVTSVALLDGSTAPIYNISGSPVTSSGTLTFTLATQTANTVFAGPTTGSAAQPTFRSLVAADIPSLSATYVTQSEVGAASGVASLDGGGKVPLSQLPSALMEFQGNWNPSTNSPALVDGTGTTGFTYWVSTAYAGPVAGLTDPSMVNFQIGDLVIYNGTKWVLTTPAAGVSSVNGSQGAVTVNAINQLTGDATAGPASGSQSQVLTLATVNSNVGSFGSSTSIPSFTVNAKGLITAASGNAVVAPAGTLSGTTLNSTVVNSSLTSLGTIATGVWNGSAIGPTFGGTGQTTYTAGDLLYASATNVLSKLGIGSNGQVLTVVSGLPAWAPGASGTVTSVALLEGSTTPIFNISGSPVTTSGTLDFTLKTQTANTVFAGPSSGSAAQPTFRALVSQDIPTDNVTIDQNGAGNTIEVLAAPATKISQIAGVTFAATTLFAVRYGKTADGGTFTGRVYKADYDTTSADNFWCIGLVYPPGSVSVGGAITVTEVGLITATGHGFTVGQPVWLTSAGVLSSTAPSASLQACVKVGMVKDANTIDVNIQLTGVN